MLVSRTTGAAQLIVIDAADERNGIEAWRRLNLEYNPTTEASSRAYVKAILSYSRVARLDQALPKIAEFEEMCRHYREHSEATLSDDLLAG